MTNEEILYLADLPGEGRRTLSVEVAAYPDGMPLVKYLPRTAERMLLRPRSLGSFMSAMFLVDAMAERGRAIPGLILPCVPGARQDRLNPAGDALFTAKSVAKEINARRFPSVTVVDPHSDVTPALIDRCAVVHADACVSPPAGKYAAVISPDGGAEKRAGAVARKLGVPLLHAWKTRDVSTGAISGFGVEPIALGEGARLLVVDDICDAGGTFLGLADAISTDRAQRGGPRLKLDLFVTHGLFTKGTGALLEKFAHVYCTDSTIGERPGVIEIDVCRQLLEGSLRP